MAKAKVMKEWLGNLPSFFQLLITPLNICHIPAVSELIMLMPEMFFAVNMTVVNRIESSFNNCPNFLL